MNNKGVLLFFRRAVNFGFYSLALFSPLSISATQAALSIILLSWIALMITERRFIFAKTSLNYPFLAYLCAVIIAAIFGVDFIHSAKSINKLWIILTFFSVLTFIPHITPCEEPLRSRLCAGFIEDIKMVRRLVYILLVVTSIVSIYGVLQHIFPGIDIARPEGRKVVQWAEGGVASTGFFDHHMTYGGYLLLVFSLSFSLFLSNIKERGLLIFYVLSTILIAGGLISSMARNTWVGSLFAIFFIILFRIKNRIILSFVAGLIILSVVTYTLVPVTYLFQSSILSRFKSIFDVSKNVERLYIWKSTIDMIIEHPLTGVGMDNYSKAIHDYRDKYNHEFGPGTDAHAHNNILTQAAEHGMLGLTAFLWIWVGFFKEGIRIYRDLRFKLSTQHSALSTSIVLGGLGAIVGFHIAGMFENNFGDAEVATMVWFIMGLVFLMKKI
jgi:O-antigen ligase